MRRNTPLNPFSPWRNTPVILQSTIVGRDFMIESIVEKAGDFAQGSPAKHCLLIGRRGLGKTHMLSLLYHYFEGNCTLTGFESISGQVLPVILLEEERFSLNSLAQFLLSIFERFAEKTGDKKKWAIPESLETDDDVCEYCFEYLKNISAADSKKIIFLCDNLEEIFKQWGEKEYKKLRVFLSDQRAVMIIGTAVRVFKEIVSPKQPFYEFFERVPLVDLTDEQMLEVLEKRFSGDNLEKEFEKKEKHLKNKVAAISTLTGGNPRLVVFLYDIVTKKNVFEIENATEELMESLNEYFRNRFTELSPQERTILDTFAAMDGPATPKEVSKKTRIKEHSVRTNIKRLKDAGYIDTVEYGKHRASRYDVTERLFRLWRQTATISGKKKFRIFIKFLELYFTPDELKEDFNRSVELVDSYFQQNKQDYVNRILHYLSYLQQAAKGNLKYEIFDKRTDYLLKIGDYEKAEIELTEFKKELNKDESIEVDSEPLFWKYVETLFQQKKYRAVQKHFSWLIYIPENKPVLDDIENAIEYTDRMIEECPDDEELFRLKGKLLFRIEKFDKALVFFRKASELKPNVPDYYFDAGMSLIKLNRLEEALSMIPEVFEQFKIHSEEIDPKIAKWKEGFMIGRARGLYRMLADKHDENYQARLAQGLPEIPGYRFIIAQCFRETGRPEKALRNIEKAIELEGQNAEFWGEKGRILYNLSKYNEALKTFQQASELLPLKSEFYIQQGMSLYEIERLDEALIVVEKAIDVDKNNSINWWHKIKILNRMEKFEEAHQSFLQMILLEPDNIGLKLLFLKFLIFSIRRLDEAGNYLNELESIHYEKIKDNLDYLHWKSEYLLLTGQFEEAVPWTEKRLKEDQHDWDAKITSLINKGCIGDFGENMEGLAVIIAKEELKEAHIAQGTDFIFMILDYCMSRSDTKRATGLYMTLVRLNQWHNVSKVQETIALYLRKLVNIGNRDLFIDSVEFAREHITNKDLLELLKAFLYAGKYMREGNKVILEEVFPEIRDIIFDIVEKFEEKSLQ